MTNTCIYSCVREKIKIKLKPLSLTVKYNVVCASFEYF